MFAPWRSQNPVRKTRVSGYWKIIQRRQIIIDCLKRHETSSSSRATASEKTMQIS